MLFGTFMAECSCAVTSTTRPAVGEVVVAFWSSPHANINCLFDVANGLALALDRLSVANRLTVDFAVIGPFGATRSEVRIDAFRFALSELPPRLVRLTFHFSLFLNLCEMWAISTNFCAFRLW